MKKRRILDNGIVADKVMPLDQAVNFIGEHRIIVHYSNQSQVGLFTPGRKMKQDFKRSIYKHRQDVVNLMQSGDTRLCPAPELHSQSWLQGRCEKCVQLDASINACHTDKRISTEEKERTTHET